MTETQGDLPWKESRFHNNNAKEQDQDEENDDMFAMFADPDPHEVFHFEFPGEINIELHGQKQENGQLLHSTGLTLWRAAELLCRYIVDHQELVRDNRVLELGAGLGLCGILAHKLGAKHMYLTDGDVDTLENLRSNVARNKCDGDKVSCPQLIWGQVEQYPEKNVETILAADIIYVTEILEPLWSTVSAILSPGGRFILGYARRNVPIDLVLKHATDHGFRWTCPTDVEGVFVFERV